MTTSKREESLNRARRRKLRDPKKFDEAIEKRKALGLPLPQKPTRVETIMRMHSISKRKVSLPTLKFADDGHA